MEQLPVTRYWCHRCLSTIYLEYVSVSPLTLRCPNCGERLVEVAQGSVVWFPNEIRVDGVVQTSQSGDQWWDAFVGWLESRGETFNGRIEAISPLDTLSDAGDAEADPEGDGRDAV